MKTHLENGNVGCSIYSKERVGKVVAPNHCSNSPLP